MNPHLQCALALLCATAATGCGGEAAVTPPDDADVVESDLTGTVKGTYTVPMADPAASAVASFPVTVKVQQLRSGAVRMHYTLPAELVGVPQSVDFTGPANGSVMTGSAGTAQCSSSPSETVCNERLPGTRVDTALVKTAVDSMTASAAEKALRLDVSAKFSIDPIGIVRFANARAGGQGGGGQGGGGGGGHGRNGND